MRKLLFVALLLPLFLVGQVAKDYAILVTAELKNNPDRIILSWPASSSNSYIVYRKLKSENAFGPSLAQLPGSATGYVDKGANLNLNECYEYFIKKNGTTAGYGYINTGVCLRDDYQKPKGRLLLLIDSTHADALKFEVNGFIDDLEGETYSVIKHIIPPSMTVNSVKQLIKSEYNKYKNPKPNDSTRIESLILLGHIPVPYSGNLAPDAHPDHIGAWPSDAFYADMDGIWTDASVNTTSPNDPRNHNIPGDGKFDQSILPSNLEFEVGRIDFANMSAFSKSETELLRDYLNKNHAYRTREFDVNYRGLIDDNFGAFNNEAFAASAWKAFSTFFGPDSIYSNVGTSVDFRTDLNKDSYLWSYGCGGGSYTSCGGIGNTSQLAGDSLQSVFTLLFGSYFGDWDKTNSFLRAPLAQGLTLTNAWSGRPHWYFHHMAMGENIGYSFLKTINNNPYYQHYASKFVHIALMGDPTLRMYTMKPPYNLTLSEIGNTIKLNWDHSSEPDIDSYVVFRKDSIHQSYQFVGSVNSTANSFIDVDFDHNGKYFYAVRARRIDTTKSGIFFNLSGGAVGELNAVYVGESELLIERELSISPNPANDVLLVQSKGLVRGIYNLQIQSMSGNVISQSSIYLNENGSADFDVSSIANGMYLITVVGNDASISTKLVVIH